MSNAIALPPSNNAFKIVVKVAVLINRTTRTEIRDGKRLLGGKEDKLSTAVKIEFVEFTNKGIKLEIPPRTCTNGHKLELQFEFVTSQETIVFQTDGTVERAESLSSQQDNIYVAMNNFDTHQWSVIQKLFNQRQAGVTDLFERLKGNR